MLLPCDEEGGPTEYKMNWVTPHAYGLLRHKSVQIDKLRRRRSYIWVREACNDNAQRETTRIHCPSTRVY